VSEIRLFFALYRGYYPHVTLRGIRRHIHAFRLAWWCMKDRWAS
jgi:hypothetical protein